MNPVVAMPRFRRGMKMAFHLDEDDVTLAWDAVRKSGLATSTPVTARGIELPEWWWKGTGLAHASDADVVVEPVPTTKGPSVVVHARGPAPEVEAEAARIHAAAPTLTEMQWQKIRLARDGPDTEADFPLGAYVAQARHDEVTAQRMRLLAGKVATWTTIGPGAAPTEFIRLQDAVGAYHVAIVAFPDGSRTAGLWAGMDAPGPGAPAVPVLRRLYRTQGAWRYGVKFAAPA